MEKNDKQDLNNENQNIPSTRMGKKMMTGIIQTTKTKPIIKGVGA